MEIRRCGIQNIHENAFDGLAEDLIELNLNENSLKTIPFLGRLKKLQNLKLGFNQVLFLFNFLIIIIFVDRSTSRTLF